MKKRFDSILVEKNFFSSRTKCQVHILAGEVYVDGVKETRPSKLIDQNATIDLKLISDTYVSRSAEKLSAAISKFKIKVNSKICLDIGASTGGFTECLLKNKAKKIYSVDVGYGQLDYKLRNHEKIVNIEKKNARYLTKNEIPDEIDLIVMDVSFISITKFGNFFKEFSYKNLEYIGLVKPQFELKREKIDKGGIVKNEKYRIEAILNVKKFLGNYFNKISEPFDSPIKGAKGNQESLIYCSNL